MEDNAKIARSDTNPSLEGQPQLGNALTDMEIIGQLVGSNTTSPRGDEVMQVAINNGVLDVKMAEQLSSPTKV